ncbi:MAG: pyroglutamyl-peptidase I [Pirellulaceae bacterium]
MCRVLITAFAPYDQWDRNASWLALVALTSELPDHPEITTRLYPANLDALREHLQADLADEYDVTIHLGQHPGSSALALEAIGINVAQPLPTSLSHALPLVPDGPVAYRSPLPLERWAQLLRSSGVPAVVSYHAGTYLCNAALFLAQHIIAENGYKSQSTFIHVPLDTTQTVDAQGPLPALPSALVARGLRVVLNDIADSVDAAR